MGDSSLAMPSLDLEGLDSAYHPSGSAEETFWSSVPARTPRIWVVDDDPVVRRYIVDALKGSQYYVESWESARAAWDPLQSLEESEWPDMVICDWVMPEMSGVEFCRRLKGSAAGQFVYFILLTSRSEVEARVEGLDAGADEFITKPVDPEELRARVRAGLRLQRLTQALAQANRQLRARNELLESLSLTDPLTGALNRRALDQALPHLLKQVGPRGEARYRYLCLLMMDVDHFKQINDSHGHYIGDCVLQAIVGRLQNQLRPSSLLYRYGGEEFVCVTPGLSPPAVVATQSLCGRLSPNGPLTSPPSAACLLPSASVGSCSAKTTAQNRKPPCSRRIARSTRPSRQGATEFTSSPQPQRFICPLPADSQRPPPRLPESERLCRCGH